MAQGPRDRVRRPKDKEQLLNELIEQRNPFATFRDVMIFSAAVGLAERRRIAFDQTSEPIPWAVMAGGGAEVLVNLIALVDSKDLAVLEADRFDERIRVFEEYANGGLEIIQQRLGSSPGGALDAIRELIREQEQVDGPLEDVPPLSQLAEELSI